MGMTYKVNHIGEKYNSLTVIDFVPRKSTNQYWLCKCDCGNTSIVSMAHLKTNHTKTCGKCKWIGKKFGLLTVIEETSKRTSDNHIIVKCQCECGNIVEKGVDNLVKNQDSISCGCNTKSGGELKIRKILQENNLNFQEEYSFEDLVGKNNHKLRFDFAVFNQDNTQILFLIEFDGLQHFQDVNIFPNAARTRELDLVKNQYCEQHKIKLIRIPYYDESIIDYDYIMKAAYGW